MGCSFLSILIHLFAVFYLMTGDCYLTHHLILVQTLHLHSLSEVSLLGVSHLMKEKPRQYPDLNLLQNISCPSYNYKYDRVENHIEYHVLSSEYSCQKKYQMNKLGYLPLE